MFHAIGHFLKKVLKKISKIAKGVSKKGKHSKGLSETVNTPAAQQARKTGSMAVKLVILTVIASGVFLSGFAAHPVGVPIAAALGGEIARTSAQIWST
jgi:hypothetical protein